MYVTNNNYNNNNSNSSGNSNPDKQTVRSMVADSIRNYSKLADVI